MASDRVECPECRARFLVPENELEGVIVCRDCRAEFTLEPLDDPETEPVKPKAKPKTKPKTQDADDEPDDWKTDLPVRSPIPILIGLLIVQGVIGIVLIGYGMLAPSLGGSSTSMGSAPNSSYFNTTTTKKATAPTSKR